MYKIGVDAGGTKTTACLFFKDDIIDTVQTGMGNVLVNFDDAITHIIQAVSTLMMKQSIQQLDVLSVGCAGGSTTKDIIKERLQQQFTQTKIVVDTDIAMSHIATFKNQDGALLICGTGSVVLSRSNGQFKQIGGWGHILGDQGSGYWLAKQMITDYIDYLESSHCKDGFEQLLPILQQQFPTRDAIINSVYKQPKSELAKLAKLTTQYADNVYVKQLCYCGVQKLAQQVRQAVTSSHCLIAFEGSVILNHNMMQKQLLTLLNEQFKQVKVVPKKAGTMAVLYM